MRGRSITRLRRSTATLLFVGASISQAAAIRRAGALGYVIAGVDGDPGAVAFP